jgi:cytochrome oxidase assembly protein ShyY1
MLRPKSLALLVVSIGVALAFAFFGQWQLSRAVDNGDILARTTETVQSLQEVAAPQETIRNEAVGQLVRADGAWVDGDFLVLAERYDEGRPGFWVAGHWRTDDGGTLAVALGWTADEQDAIGAAAGWNADGGPAATAVEGRYQQAEAPTPPDDGRELPTEMAVAAFINEWADAVPAYNGYVTLADAPAPLAAIYSPAPEREVQLNFLNLFYAAEWVLFSLAALYIWYRLIRDVWEKERDEAEAAAGDGVLAARKVD